MKKIKDGLLAFGFCIISLASMIASIIMAHIMMVFIIELISTVNSTNIIIIAIVVIISTFIGVLMCWFSFMTSLMKVYYYGQKIFIKK